MDFQGAQFQPRRKKHHKWPWITLGIILVLLIVVGLYFHFAKRPQLKERSQTIQFAQKYAGMHDINHYYYSNLNGKYYSVGGKNKLNQYSYAIVSKNHKDAQVVTQKNGISPERADEIARQKIGATKILNTALSVTDKKPVWIVTAMNKKKSISYLTVSFKNGKVVQVLKNL